MLKIIAFYPLLILFLVQSSRPQLENVLDTCTCDLTGNHCDVNCCCDQDCTQSDQASFSICINQPKSTVEEVCVSDSLLLSAQQTYNVKGNGNGLFCIYRDNYQERYF